MPVGLNKITVLMAVYNDSRYVSQSVKSILHQTYKEFEFLIIDDGSSDNTEAVIKNFNDPRIKYAKISHTGLAGALNYGLKHSSGEWIARIDADDINTPDRLELQMNFINSNREYDVIAGCPVYFEDPLKILFEIKTPSDDEEIKRFLNLHNPINHSSVIFRRKKIRDNGGYNEGFKSYEDFELWFRLREQLKFKILPEVLVYTRMRNDSMTKTGSRSGIYWMLKENALTNLGISVKDEEVNYWKNLLFWIEYFYGNKVEARKYSGKALSFRQSIAFLNTFLPDRTFEKILGMRLRYRMQSAFLDKAYHKKKLQKLKSL